MASNPFLAIRDRRRSSARRRARGAVLVEATIVIAALSLGLLALLFFKDLYMKKLELARLARASAVAHSMLGCGDVRPHDWAGTDLGGYLATNPQQRNENARGARYTESQAPTGEHSAHANGILDKIGGWVSDGAEVLNPITRAEFSGLAAATKETVPGRNTFEAPVGSRSYVSCGDTVRDGDIDSVVEFLREDLIGLKDAGQ